MSASGASGSSKSINYRLTSMVAAAAAAELQSSGASKAPKVSAPRFVTPVGLPALDPALLNYQDSFRTSSMNTYNVTVNGALDSESTARQIVKLLTTLKLEGL
jgi:hypothetical protein